MADQADTTTLLSKNPSTAKTESPNPRVVLTTLKDTDKVLADSGQDIRGHDVIAQDGDKIGKVDALLVDAQESKVRFIQVEAGGFLGIGEKKWLIPVDAITRVDNDHVYVNQTREKITNAPAYDPDLAEQDEDFYPGLYSHYGSGPFWRAGYVYPMWWGGM
jgi:hypothetical protein